MGLSITPLGGFGEVGRNSVAIDIDGDIIIIDMGFHLERFIELTNDDFPSKKTSVRQLVSAGALPDIRLIHKEKVKAIVCSHAHLDHVAAIPFLAPKFHCAVHCTPFTGHVISSLCEDKGVSVQIVSHKVNSSFTVGDNTIEFISVAHSTPESSIIAVHTKYGVILYANDYKDDQTPPLGDPTNMKRINELAGKVKVLMLDCLYAGKDGSCPSESFARDSVLDVGVDSVRTLLFTTFSSHISRLKTFCDYADSIGRIPVFMGRSLFRYIEAAKDAGVVDLTTRGEIHRFAKHARSFLRKKIEPEKYLFITTGNQGEPKAMLSKMASGLYAFNSKDAVVFSCNIIPVPVSIKNRGVLESRLRDKGVRVIRDIHVSGHAWSDDHARLLDILKPEILIPSHGEPVMMRALSDIARRLGISRVVHPEIGRCMDVHSL